MHTRGIMMSFLVCFTGWIWLIIVLNYVSAVCVMRLPIGVNCPQRRQRVEGTIPPHLLLFLKTKRFNEHLCRARWRRRKRKGEKKGGHDTAWRLFSEQWSTSRQNEERVKDDDDAASQQDALNLERTCSSRLQWQPRWSGFIVFHKAEFNYLLRKKKLWRWFYWLGTASVRNPQLLICSFALTWKRSKEKSVCVWHQGLKGQKQ